jgi:hypothetical protein
MSSIVQAVSPERRMFSLLPSASQDFPLDKTNKHFGNLYSHKVIIITLIKFLIFRIAYTELNEMNKKF